MSETEKAKHFSTDFSPKTERRRKRAARGAFTYKFNATLNWSNIYSDESFRCLRFSRRKCEEMDQEKIHTHRLARPMRVKSFISRFPRCQYSHLHIRSALTWLPYDGLKFITKFIDFRQCGVEKKKKEMFPRERFPFVFASFSELFTSTRGVRPLSIIRYDFATCELHRGERENP